MHRVAGLMMALAAGTAQAQDVTVLGGAELEFLHEEDGPDTGTNTYLSGYVEVDASGFYAGLWAQVSEDDLMDEVEVYLGYRNQTAGGVSYDVGYTRYFYPGDGGDCCGDITLSLGVPVGATLGATLDLAYDPQSNLREGYVGGSWAPTNALELSANYGFYEEEAAPTEQEWDLGATYSLGEKTAADLRWYDGSDYVDSYLGLSLTWDSTLLGG